MMEKTERRRCYRAHVSLSRDKRAVAVIARVLAVDDCRDALMVESTAILNQLVRILEPNTGFSKDSACTALKG